MLVYPPSSPLENKFAGGRYFFIRVTFLNSAFPTFFFKPVEVPDTDSDLNHQDYVLKDKNTTKNKKKKKHCLVSKSIWQGSKRKKNITYCPDRVSIA